VAPDSLPWDALRALLSQCIYGGKIDNTFDQVLLDCFIDRLFTAKSFDHDFVLITNVDGHGAKLTMPEGVRREQFVEWTEAITHLQAPVWLGLPNNAEKVLLTERGACVSFCGASGALLSDAHV
jgi:dynein heavy chain 1